MKRLLLNFSFAFTFLAAGLLFADDSDKLSGKWSVKKTIDSGQSITQTIEIKKDKFIFEIMGADGKAALHAEGDVKFEKEGPFNVAHFLHIRAGQSASDLQEVSEERRNVYVMDGENWLMASNFEEDRDQKPSLDVYQKVKAAAQGGGGGSLVIDEIQMVATPQSATWFFCFEAKLGDATRRYYVENKGFEKSQVTIPIALELPKAKAGEKVSFKMQLDDIDGDACSDEPDNKSTGEFQVSDRGSQSFKPENDWQYTIRWHLK
jgi:hypothetical protein